MRADSEHKVGGRLWGPSSLGNEREEVLWGKMIFFSKVLSQSLTQLVFITHLISHLHSQWLYMTEKNEAIRMKITDSCHYIYLPHNCGLMFIKAWSPGQQYRHHWGTCQKCKLLDSTSDLLDQILRMGPSNLCLSKCSKWFWWSLRVCEPMRLGLCMFL